MSNYRILPDKLTSSRPTCSLSDHLGCVAYLPQCRWRRGGDPDPSTFLRGSILQAAPAASTRSSQASRLPLLRGNFLIDITQAIATDLNLPLGYFRDRFSELAAELLPIYGQTQYKKCAAAFNQAAVKSVANLQQAVQSAADVESWPSDVRFSTTLMVQYAGYVAMIEGRNQIWPYEYMAFSRRMGELWQGFCQLAFDYPIRPLRPIVPPLFSDVRRSLHRELSDYIQNLPLEETQKQELHRYYQKVWMLVDSGEVSLELDLHFEQDGQKVVVDFKSGFGSNEKGNTNRLLLVATIYRNLVETYRCLLLVRSPEDQNNHYFRTLRDSTVWEAYCGAAAYDKIGEFTGFDLQGWIAEHVDWLGHLSLDTKQLIEQEHLEGYVQW